MPLHRRAVDPQENIVLANCVDNNGVKSSQMAYFIGVPSASPSTVAIVATSPGTTMVWEGGTVTASFLDGVLFTANIPNVVLQGQYAGQGHNGGASSFSCWANYVSPLYNWGANTCTEIYYCNHAAAPAVTSSPMTTTPTNTATIPQTPNTLTTAQSQSMEDPGTGSTNTQHSSEIRTSTQILNNSGTPAQSASTSGTSTNSASNNGNNALSTGSEIASIVGGLVGFFALCITVYLCIKKRNKKRRASAING